MQHSPFYRVTGVTLSVLRAIANPFGNANGNPPILHLGNRRVSGLSQSYIFQRSCCPGGTARSYEPGPTFPWVGGLSET